MEPGRATAVHIHVDVSRARAGLSDLRQSPARAARVRCRHEGFPTIAVYGFGGRARLINSGLDSPEMFEQKSCRGPATFNRFYPKAEQRDPMRFTRDVICCTPPGASRI